MGPRVTRWNYRLNVSLCFRVFLSERYSFPGTCLITVETVLALARCALLAADASGD